MSARLSHLRPRSLVAKLTLYYAVSAMALLIVALCLLYWALVSSIHKENDEMLSGEFSELAQMLQGYRQNPIVVDEEVRTASLDSGRPLLMRIISASGVVVAESPGMEGILPRALFPKAVKGSSLRIDRTIPISPGVTRSYRLSASRIVTRDGTYNVQIAVDVSFERRLLSKYAKPVALIFAGASVGCILLGYWLARGGVQPMRQMVQTIGRVESTSLNHRLETVGVPEEFSELADTFNAMLSRVEDAFARLSRFSADIAHELRTPVSVLNGQLEVALGRARTVADYRHTLESCLEETTRLSNLINRLLFLARAEAKQAQIGREWLDISAELEKIRDFYDPITAEAQIALVVAAEPYVAAYLDRTLLQSAIGNLVENAIDYTPPHGCITVSAKNNGKSVSVAVADTGVGIPSEHLPYIFDRFYRSESSRPSRDGHLGLGLALVQSIVKLHDGQVRAESSAESGTCITLEFPVVETARA